MYTYETRVDGDSDFGSKDGFCWMGEAMNTKIAQTLPFHVVMIMENKKLHMPDLGKLSCFRNTENVKTLVSNESIKTFVSKSLSRDFFQGILSIHLFQRVYQDTCFK